MSISKNDVTGDSIQTKDITEQYRINYDLIFGKKVKVMLESENNKFIQLHDKPNPTN